MLEPQPPKLDRLTAQRLELLLRQLRLQRLAVARRDWNLSTRALADPRLLACYDEQGGWLPEAAAALPPELLELCLRQGRGFEIGADASEGPMWLRASGFVRVRVWLGPADALASVYFLGLWRLAPRLELTRERLAASAFETLAQSLAPPAWLRQAPIERDGAAASPNATATERGPGELLPLREALRRVERQLLRKALQLAEGNRAEAARSLSVPRSSLYRKLKEHGLIPD